MTGDAVDVVSFASTSYTTAQRSITLIISLEKAERGLRAVETSDKCLHCYFHFKICNNYDINYER